MINSRLLLGRIFFCCTILAFAVLQAAYAEEDSSTTPSAPTMSPTRFRCLGICGDEEGALEEPRMVVSYQWNPRVPVCSGLSCETASCAALEKKLGLMELTEFECTNHRRELQDTAGCICSEPKPRPEKKEDTLPQKGDSGYHKQHYNWTILVIVSMLYILI